MSDDEIDTNDIPELTEEQFAEMRPVNFRLVIRQQISPTGRT